MLLRKSSELAEMQRVFRIDSASEILRRVGHHAPLRVRSNANPDSIELSRMEMPPPPVADS
jgi:hypothetical protein